MIPIEPGELYVEEERLRSHGNGKDSKSVSLACSVTDDDKTPHYFDCSKYRTGKCDCLYEE